MPTHNLINPGMLEVICGPMFSGKSLALINRVEKLKYLQGSKYQFFKPAIDTRSTNVKTRFKDLEMKCINIQNPNHILDKLEDDVHLVCLDEVNFFQKNIVNVVTELLNRDINVIAAGLDLDYRGEPFGPMPELLAMADDVEKLFATCFFSRCPRKATRTQRLINGEYAHYDAPLVVIEGSGNEVYEARCLKHYCVPGKQDKL